MQINDAQKQELIKAKLRELAALEAELPKEQPMNLYEAEEPEQPQVQQAQYQEQQEPQQKYYDIEQMLVVMWAETVTATILEVPMSEFKRSRLMMVRDKLLYEMDLSEFVSKTEEPSQPESAPQSHEDEINDVVDNMVDPKFSETNRDLDTISQKMKDIDSKEGLMQPEVEEEEPTGLKKLLGMGGKKKIIERSVDEKHQSSSMG
jgi:hypothetical protein